MHKSGICVCPVSYTHLDVYKRQNTSTVLKNITDVIIVQADGTQTALGLGGYLDIGLLDTMEDLFVNFIGALTVSYTHLDVYKRQRPG